MEQPLNICGPKTLVPIVLVAMEIKGHVYFVRKGKASGRTDHVVC